MTSTDAVVRDRYGLHPRAAMRIQQLAAGFRASMTLRASPGAPPVPASAMIGLVSLGVRSGESVHLEAQGPDEVEAIAALRALCESGICHP